MIDSGFETKSVRMQLLLLVSFQAPSADVDRIMDAVVAITPLGMGSYDSNAFQSNDTSTVPGRCRSSVSAPAAAPS
ncbi:MAG: hypothetical protein E5W60_18850, partial [Mesorhizobium sp.]